MATTVKFYPSASKSIHREDLVGWYDLIKETSGSRATGYTDASTTLSSGSTLDFTLKTNTRYPENSVAGGVKWQELSRIALLFDTSSLPSTLAIMSATLRMTVQSVSSTSEWDPSYSVGAYGYSPATTSPSVAITTADYMNMGSTTLGNEVSSSTLSAGSHVSITLTDFSWVNQNGTSQVSFRMDKDVNEDGFSWVDRQEQHLRFYDHTADPTVRPYLEVVYEDAANYTLSFTEDLTSLDQTDPASMTRPAQAVTVAHSTLNTNLKAHYKLDNNVDDSKG